MIAERDYPDFEPAANERPLEEKEPLFNRVAKVMFYIHALNLRGAILATLSEIQKLDPTLCHVYLADATDATDAADAPDSRLFRTCNVLILSSTMRAPYHLPNPISALVSFAFCLTENHTKQHS